MGSLVWRDTHVPHHHRGMPNLSAELQHRAPQHQGTLHRRFAKAVASGELRALRLISTFPIPTARGGERQVLDYAYTRADADMVRAWLDAIVRKPRNSKRRAARQSTETRLARLSRGLCPVHGAGMGQVDGMYTDEHGKSYTVVECFRRDCTITARAYSHQGPFLLIGAHAELVGQTPTATPDAHEVEGWPAQVLPRDLYERLFLAANRTSTSIDDLVEQAVREHLDAMDSASAQAVRHS